MNMIYSTQKRFSVIQRTHPKGVKPKMRGRKLRSAVNWQGTLMQKRVKQGLDALNEYLVHYPVYKLFNCNSVLVG